MSMNRGENVVPCTASYTVFLYRTACTFGCPLWWNQLQTSYENARDVTSPSASRSASEYSHFRTRPSFRPYIAPIEIGTHEDYSRRNAITVL